MLMFKSDSAEFSTEGDRVVMRFKKNDDGVDAPTVITVHDEGPLRSLLVAVMVALRYEVATLSPDGKLLIKAAHGVKGES